MKVYNITPDEIEIQNVSPKFAVQWGFAVSQGRSLEFAAMSEAERDKEFPVAAYEAKKACEAVLVAEIKRKYPISQNSTGVHHESL